jgi:hypothetical protein
VIPRRRLTPAQLGEALLDLLGRAPLSPRARAVLLDLFGRADDAWYWFYQGALCVLGEDPKKADAMYERGSEARAWHDIVRRLRDGPDDGPGDFSDSA